MTKIQSGSIVVGTDGSPHAARAVQWATEQAALERRPLVVLAVAAQVPALVAAGPGAAYAFAPDDLLAAARSHAAAAVDLASRHRPGLTIEAVALTGDPRTALVEATGSAHLLVLGSRGRGRVRSKILGSVGAAVVRQAACPVVVCRPGTELKVKRGVLVGGDGTLDSLPVIDFAFRLASLRSQPLTVVHVGESLAAAESVAGFRERYPEVNVTVWTSRLAPADALAAVADRHDLVVVGRHPVDRVTRHLGEVVSTTVLERSRTNLAVVPETSYDALR